MAHLGSRVAAYVDGQLAVDAAADARDHLQTCEECQESVRQQHLLKRRVTGLNVAPAPSVSLLSSLADLDHVRSVACTDRSLKARAGRILRSPRMRALVAITGASVTVTAVAYAVGAPVRDDAEAMTPPVERFVQQFAAKEGAAALAKPSDGSLSDDSLNVGVFRLRAAPAARFTDSDDPAAVELLRSTGGALDNATIARLIDNFDLSVGSAELVDGRRASEVVASADGKRVAAYWVAAGSGRVLRKVTYDDDGTPVRAQPSGDPSTAQDAEVLQAGLSTTPIPDSTLKSLTESGWPCHGTLARDLERVDGAWFSASNERVVTLTYTDGVSTLSLFEQSGSLDRGRRDGFEAADVDGSRVWIRPGSPTVAMWDEAGVVYTVVTNADRKRLEQAIVDLPGSAQEKGHMARIGRGLERLTRGANPLRSP